MAVYLLSSKLISLSSLAKPFLAFGLKIVIIMGWNTAINDVSAAEWYLETTKKYVPHKKLSFLCLPLPPFPLTLRKRNATYDYRKYWITVKGSLPNQVPVST